MEPDRPNRSSITVTAPESQAGPIAPLTNRISLRPVGSITAFEQVALGALAKFDVAATVTRTLERGITAEGGDPT